MNFIRHNFAQNYMTALQVEDHSCALDILTSEIARWIISDPITFSDVLKDAGVKTNAITSAELAKDFCDNLGNPDYVSILAMNLCNHSRDLYDALIKGFTAMKGVQDSSDPSCDWYGDLKRKVNVNDEKMAAADGSGNIGVDSTTTTAPATVTKKGFHVTWSAAGKTLVFVFAAYGFYRFIKDIVHPAFKKGTIGGGQQQQPAGPANVSAGQPIAGMGQGGTATPVGTPAPATIQTIKLP